GRKAQRMQRPDVDAALDFVRRPQRPLPRLGLAFERGRAQPPVLAREIEIDGERLPQDEAAVVDRRQPAIGIDGEIVGLARAGRTGLDREMFVVEAELLRHPDGAKGAGAGDAVNAQAGHVSPVFASRPSTYSTTEAPSQ